MPTKKTTITIDLSTLISNLPAQAQPVVTSLVNALEQMAPAEVTAWINLAKTDFGTATQQIAQSMDDVDLQAAIDATIAQMQADEAANAANVANWQKVAQAFEQAILTILGGIVAVSL